jgi:hypothetical protein
MLTDCKYGYIQQDQSGKRKTDMMRKATGVAFRPILWLHLVLIHFQTIHDPVQGGSVDSKQF